MGTARNRKSIRAPRARSAKSHSKFRRQPAKCPIPDPLRDELKEIRDRLALVRATATIAETALRTRTSDFVAVEAAAVLRRYVVSDVDGLVVRLNDVIIFDGFGKGAK